MIHWKSVLFSVALMVSFAASSAIDVHEFDSVEQEQLFKELSSTLRCPKCQNNSIGDSNAPLAQDLRQKVYEMLKQGKSEDQIVDYMIARYGNFVTYNPPITAATSILWLGPIAVVLLGFGFIVLRSRKKPTAAQQQWDEDKEARLKALLDEEQSKGAKGDKK
ncbi:cytochrome c-type biogenesis protein [Vibrio sp. SCSIO 43136]|uniref:cytochrome c-type biogenesis protein n=1 Tax=Vibrio sp. SCSIO 43136 TaxID=2819101 RepID=UPI002074EF56|nr:cytochrome c-type biogenesis protein [Vibrio sp. SCSIO 43136]USD66006.1 cytochrome c-type biogenesis protein CcmH [Vibrio sp. SCSIO 43136]